MPFILDVLVEFLIRIAINTFKKVRSKPWPVTTSTITGAYLGKGHTGGSQLAVVTYNYRVEGERYVGTQKEPFLIGSLGEDYIRRFPADCETPVRVNPADPAKSVLVRG